MTNKNILIETMVERARNLLYQSASPTGFFASIVPLANYQRVWVRDRDDRDRYRVTLILRPARSPTAVLLGAWMPHSGM